MIIYTDNSTMFGAALTPAHTYAATSDFSNILHDIERGLIPTNTQQPFPVVWENEGKPDPYDDTPPWISNTNYPDVPSDGFVNPWKK
jgi:hypothetical protein